MFGVGWAELALVAVVAVLVIPPKDMPRIMHEAGKFVGKLRRLADGAKREFDNAMRIDEDKR